MCVHVQLVVWTLSVIYYIVNCESIFNICKQISHCIRTMICNFFQNVHSSDVGPINVCVLSAAICGTCYKVLCDISSNHHPSIMIDNIWAVMEDNRQDYHNCFMVYCVLHIDICARVQFLHTTNCLGLAFCSLISTTFVLWVVSVYSSAAMNFDLWSWPLTWSG